MRKIIAALVSASLLAGCTGTLEPIGVAKNYSGFNQGTLTGCGWPQDMSLQHLIAPERSEQILTMQRLQDQQDQDAGSSPAYANSRLDWLSCEMLAKSMENFEQAEGLANRSEWRDIPLLASALTVATLVLFGTRGMDGSLTSGETDVIEGFALGSSGVILLSNYLAPGEAADLLYQSAKGHRCLAEHGQAISVYGRDVIGDTASSRAGSLSANVLELRTLVRSENDDAKKQAGLEALARAEKALAYYHNQRRAREIAPARLYLASYDFGMDLSKKARRRPVDIGDIQSTLRESIRKQQEAAGIQPTGTGDPGNKVAPAVADTASVTRNTVIDTDALLGTVPNIAAAVAQMELCTDLAVIGGTSLPKPDIAYPGTPAS